MESSVYIPRVHDSCIKRINWAIQDQYWKIRQAIPPGHKPPGECWSAPAQQWSPQVEHCSPFYPVIPRMLSTLNCYLVHSYSSRDPFPDLMAQGGNPFIHWVKHWTCSYWTKRIQVNSSQSATSHWGHILGEIDRHWFQSLSCALRRAQIYLVSIAQPGDLSPPEKWQVTINFKHQTFKQYCS